MSRPKKSDTAGPGDCDWSFLSWHGVAQALERAAARTARDYHLSPDQAGDLLAEAQMALAVRPTKVRGDWARGGAGRVASTAQAYMRDRAKTEQNHQHDSLESGYEEGDG